MNYSRGKYLSYTLKRLTSNVTREKCTEFINLKIRTENSRARGTHTASLERKRLLFVIKRTPSLLSLPQCLVLDLVGLHLPSLYWYVGDSPLDLVVIMYFLDLLFIPAYIIFRWYLCFVSSLLDITPIDMSLRCYQQLWLLVPLLSLC